MTGALSGAQLTLLRAIQDRLVPATANLLGAGALGGAERVDGYLVERPTLRPALLGALRAIEVEAAAQLKVAADHAPELVTGANAGVAGSRPANVDPGSAFLALSQDQRDAVLRAVEISAPAEFRVLVRQTYNAYYTNPVVQAALGATSPAPQPDGYPVERFDEARLARVKAAGQRWRNA